MGTRYRTLLAPVGTSTGDGRRFQTGAITAPHSLPAPLEWARSREGGHDGAVAVGAIHEVDISNDSIYGLVEFFDDVDREQLPRLAEDVAEAMHLIQAGSLGPSVDLDTFEGVPVKAGTDDPITYEDFEDEYEATGQEPKVELLITSGRIRAATLVSIPAFAETSAEWQLVEPEEALTERLTDTELAQIAETGNVKPKVEALIASVAAPELPAISAFTAVKFDGPTPITYDFETGRVFGHVALFKTCHVGYTGVCITPPRDDESTDPAFASFNRFPVETADGLVWAGRLTVGGRHAELYDTAAEAMARYDHKATAAHVRAYADEHGIAVVGLIEPGLTEGDRAILSRRKVSGDWRETANGLSLIEVLALSPGPRAHSEPGFPVETFSRSGRQVALVASLGVEPYYDENPTGVKPVDIEGAVKRALASDRASSAARARLAATLSLDARAALAAALD